MTTTTVIPGDYQAVLKKMYVARLRNQKTGNDILEELNEIASDYQKELITTQVLDGELTELPND